MITNISLCHSYLRSIKHLIVIAGPTASGKTAVAVKVAKHYNTAVLSADSRQFYKEISIGTAKPSEKEQEGVPHYFIDSHHLEDEVTSSQYESMGLDLLNKIYETHDVAVLAGGSGMFVDALCLGLDDIPADRSIKQQIIEEYEEFGLAPLLKELKEKDPNYYQQVDRDNAMRIQRALEAIRITGVPYSQQRKRKPKTRSFQVHSYVLRHDREQLYERINRRVDLMIQNGLEDEVRSVQQYRHLTSMNTVGYKEFFRYFDGEIDLATAIEKIKQNSRRYAKRQLTWLRRNSDNQWIEFTETSTVVQEILANFEEVRSKY